jgi:hypothetical protein
MSLISKDNLSLVLRSINKLLSFKADKSEVVLRNEVEEIDAIELAAKMGLVSPVAAEDGSIYTDENGAMYSL